MAHPEVLETLVIIPRAQDNLLPPFYTSAAGLEPLLYGLEVVLEHPRGHGILGGLVLMGHIKITG